MKSKKTQQLNELRKTMKDRNNHFNKDRDFEKELNKNIENYVLNKSGSLKRSMMSL